MQGVTRIKTMAGQARRKLDQHAPGVASTNYFLDRASGCIGLTFDDGPDAVHTPQVLDILAEHGAHATFFVVGNRAERHPEIVRRIVAEGHALGSHSASHPDLWELSLSAAIAEFRRGRRVLESITGAPVRLFRPPKGYMDFTKSIGLRTLGFKTWLWTVDPKDWMPGATSESVLQGLGGLVSGDVVLLHDAIERPIEAHTTDRAAMIAALPSIIRKVQGAGLTLATLS